MARFERDLFPWIGAHPVADVTAPQLLAVIQRIEKRGALETAHRALGNCEQVFRYAIQTGRAERDPSSDLRGALPPVKGKHFAAVTEPKRVGELLRMMEGYEGTLTVRCALRWAHSYSCAPVNCARRYGPILTLTPPNGATPCPKQIPRISCRCRGKRC